MESRELKMLKQLLRMNQVSYRDLSKALGISKTTICHKINGVKNCCFNLKEVELLCEELNIRREEILYYFF